MRRRPSAARRGLRAYVRSKLDFSERQSHAEIYHLHCDLLKLRRKDPVFRRQQRGGVDGAVLGDGAFVLRFFGQWGHDRLLLTNFDPDLHLAPMPEPLLAPPPERAWDILWSSEDVRYGGSGTPPIGQDGPWVVPGQTALVLAPVAREGDRPGGA